LDRSKRSELTDQLLNTGGWAEIESVGEDNAEQGQKRHDLAMEIAGEVHSTFRDGSGKYVLEYFIKSFLTKSIVRPGEDAFAQGIREGQADVIRQILRWIEISKTGEMK
jgi:hypothetical protein